MTRAFILSICAFFIFSIPNSLQAQFTSGEMSKIKALIGDWKLVHKVVDGDVEKAHIQMYEYGSSVSMGKGIDTFTIHRYGASPHSKSFKILTESYDGFIEPNSMPSFGSWKIQRQNGWLVILLRDIYYKGSGTLQRKIIFISHKKMMLVDPKTGIEYHYKRRS